MPFKTILLNDGHEIPSIAYGTGSKWKGHDVTEYVEQAIDVGFSHLDTAQFYKTEAYVGTAIKESALSRKDLFITTKYGYSKEFGFPFGVREAATQSLDQLGLEYVDLYLIHNPKTIPNQDIESTWKEFEKLKEEGLARSIGVSNFGVEDLQKLIKTAKIKPAVNQASPFFTAHLIELHPYNYHEQRAAIEYGAKHGIVIEAYSSLVPITRQPGGPVDAPVAAAAKRIGASPTQVIFLWAIAKGAIIVTTSSTKSHLEEYLATADLPPLTEDEIAAIDAAGAKGPPTKNRVWFEYARLLLVLVVILLPLYQLLRSTYI
ncbi:hypothetical protein VNI00_006927 [Paramarasmius palmivorus]|uniref:NADP-dependent oxidoreductase domain-containing protein n=1 Tax=Paramarasmius palmivorus TaxID=297713 RepID=A0AAW0D4D1_9AGAR